MKRTRVRQYVERLLAWQHRNGMWIRNQPWITLEQEISIEEAKRLFGFDAPSDAVGVRIGYSAYQPLELTIDPTL